MKVAVDSDAPILQPTVADVRALGALLVTPELIIFPVRHHSPGCAWQLHQLLATNVPSVVLVEGPRSFTSLIPSLAHPEARMPLAIYTYAVQRGSDEEKERRRAAYYPFCDHSPELVALRFAKAHNVPARFIDLDYAEQCLTESVVDDQEEAQSLLDERHYQKSRYLQALAESLGCRNHEELWEHVFEVPALARSLDDHVGHIAAYCHLARIEYNNVELGADGTLQREAEMARHIRQAITERTENQGPVVAIVGGFHAVAIHELLVVPANVVTAASAVTRKSVTDEASALIRYSFDRLDRLNGYSAGMTSPAWHQLLWEQAHRYHKAGQTASPKVRTDAALTMLFDIAHELRERHSHPLPMPTLAAAYQHALQLAALRLRPAPVRDDVLDAVRSCFVKGEADADGTLVLSVAQRMLSGQAMGKVPPGASTPPLVKDFAYRARRQRLKIDDSQPRRAVLDIYRRLEHRVTSRLLHGLTLLGIPFAMRTAGPDFVSGVGLDRLQEHWEYSHSAATEAALVEASVYGVTVPLAVANRFAARIDRMETEGQQGDAKIAAALLVHACVLGLHDHLPRVIATLRNSIANDARFESVVAAVGSISLLWESREPLEARDVVELPALLQAAYERAIFLGRDLRGIQGDGADILQALARLRETLVSEAGRALDENLYWSMVVSLHSSHDAPLIRGAAAGLLYSTSRLLESDLTVALNGHLNGLMQPREAVSYLRGLLYAAREAAWQQPALLSVLDRLLHEWDEPAFVATLPELRLAFAEMTPKETDRIAESVAQLHGARDLGRLVRYDLSERELQNNLALSRALSEVLAADGLKDWVSS